MCAVVLASCGYVYALPRVAVFATGGTISGRHDQAKGGYVPGAASGQELVASLPKLKDIADI